MSSSRSGPAARLPRPTMHADLPNKWLWCDDNSKVTKWHVNLPNRPRYSIFVASFINTANRAWEKAINPLTKMSSLDRDIVECLLEDPISAETMIDTLSKYNDFIGGGKAELKQLGLITWHEESPKDATIEQGSQTLYKKIEKTMAKYEEAEAIRVTSQNNGKSKGKGKGKRKFDATVNHQAAEDEEMEDPPPMEDEQTMVSFNDMNYEITNAGNTPATTIDKGKGKAKNPVKFGELPIVGGKKDKEAQGKKGKEAQGKKDDDGEWKKFFLGS